MFFETPVTRWGLQVSKHLNFTFNTKLDLHVDLKAGKYTTDFEVPNVEDLASIDTEAEHFVYLEENESGKGLFYIQSIVPEEAIHHLEFLHNESTPLDRKAFVFLKIDASNYLRVRDGRVIVSPTRQEWTVIKHGHNGRFITLFVPKVGYLRVDPKTKELVVSPSEPTYWMQNFTSESELILSTLVPTFGKAPREGPTEEDIIKIDCFVRDFQGEGVEIKEMTTFYKMYNVSLLPMFCYIGSGSCSASEAEFS